LSSLRIPIESESLPDTVRQNVKRGSGIEQALDLNGLCSVKSQWKHRCKACRSRGRIALHKRELYWSNWHYVAFVSSRTRNIVAAA